MSFKSLKQARASFGGYLGKDMKKADPEWARKTNFKSIPKKVKDKKRKFLKTSIKSKITNNNN